MKNCLVYFKSYASGILSSNPAETQGVSGYIVEFSLNLGNDLHTFVCY